MTAPATVAPYQAAPFVDKDGYLTQNGRLWFLQEFHPVVAQKTDIVPNATGKVGTFDDDGNLASTGKPAPSGEFVGETDSQTLTNKTLTTPTITQPTIDDFTQAQHDHHDAPGGGQVDEDSLALSNVTTANASATMHGFLAMLSNSDNDLLNGKMAWVTGYSGTLSVVTAVDFVGSAVTTKTLTFKAGQLLSIA